MLYYLPEDITFQYAQFHQNASLFSASLLWYDWHRNILDWHVNYSKIVYLWWMLHFQNMNSSFSEFEAGGAFTWMTNCPKCPSLLVFHISANIWIGIQAQYLNLNVAWFQIWISNLWHKSVPHISRSIRSQASPIQRNFLISYIIFFFWKYKEK